MLLGYKMSASLFSRTDSCLSVTIRSISACGRRPNMPASTEYGAGTLLDPERM